MTRPQPTHLTRPSPNRSRPIRAPGGLYRTADNNAAGLGGVPLTVAEDAMVAAVRMAYDVADSQIARTKRLADRLKGAADRATGNDPADGQRSAQDGLDATSRLVNNAMLSGMTWVEALMAADDGLAPRLMAAQLRAAKSVLFGGGRDRADEAPPRAEPPPPAETRFEPETTIRGVRILLPEADRRAVRIVLWEIGTPVEAKLVFRFVGAGVASPLTGELKPATQWEARPTLRMTQTPAGAPSGRWRAAVCDSDGEQHGIIEIEI